jgi:nitrate reductase gamma subunit
MDLLEFARGPALGLAFAIFALGSLWRLAGILRLPARRALSEPRGIATGAGAARAIVGHMWHAQTFRRRALGRTLNAYGYHLGLAIVAFGFVPHIAFVERLTGLSWPAPPGWLFVAGVGLAFVGLGYALLERLTSPVLRLLSTFDDYASWLVTFLPLVTGMALVMLPLASTYPLASDRPVAVAVHLMSLELLLAWLPFGKLAHAFLAFYSRAATGAAFARRGATA